MQPRTQPVAMCVLPRLPSVLSCLSWPCPRTRQHDETIVMHQVVEGAIAGTDALAPATWYVLPCWALAPAMMRAIARHSSRTAQNVCVLFMGDKGAAQPQRACALNRTPRRYCSRGVDAGCNTWAARGHCLTHTAGGGHASRGPYCTLWSELARSAQRRAQLDAQRAQNGQGAAFCV